MKLFITTCLLYITTFVIIVPTLLTTKLVRMLYVTLSVCTVFAMLGLSTTFFFIDVLGKFFSLLKYGVGIVLTFIVATPRRSSRCLGSARRSSSSTCS